MTAKWTIRAGALVATGAITIGTMVGLGGSVGAAFPGENGRIAYTRGDASYPDIPAGIGSVEPDGSGNVFLTTPGSGTFDDSPGWSPDGTRIVYVRKSETNLSVRVMNADGSGDHAIGGPGRDPAWSADGTRIVYMGVDPDTSAQQLMIMNADGTGATPVPGVPGTATSPAWSPDGEWIAFEQDDDIWKVRPDGTGLTNITNTPDEREEMPDWSPDGSLIAYDHLDDPSSTERDIWTMRPDGSDRTDITNSPGYDSNAAWSPDGTEIAFFSARSGGIWVMNADGSDQHEVISEPDNVLRAPTWQPLAPVPDETTTTTTLPGRDDTARPATPVAARPAYTG